MYAERLFELFVANNKKFLKQKSNGTYSTIKQQLTDTHFQRHLDGTETIGVFANETESKFITFDIDVSIKSAIPPVSTINWATYAVIDAIKKAGIKGDYIYPSRSGKKGMHVDIYFNQHVPLELVKMFFNYVLDTSGLNDKHRFYGYDMQVNVELRPTAQGVKVPLGIHRATGERCWYVDRDNLNRAYESFDYVSTIKQMDVNEFYTIMERIADNATHNVVPQSRAGNNKKDHVESATNTNDMVHEKMIKYLVDGLEAHGTRHNVTFHLALYLKDVLGLNAGETLDTLLAWLDKQTKYSTPYKDAVNDTKNIVKDVFTKEYRFNARRSKVKITKSEIYHILASKQSSGKATTPKQKMVMWALLLHSKYYADANGVFYMTYKQISEASGVTQDRNIKTILDELSAIGFIEIVRRNTFSTTLNKKLPNLYRINIAPKDDKEHVTLEKYDTPLKKVVSLMFTKKEVLGVLSHHQAKQLCG
ncbi:TOTE conflict system archaeo-eukaryotic primase domain-containing protein [Anoxybacillus gonensis]|uniref:TOTE conflict system archaeo-eukaryotic primase domain-containing protein n=1 Tax=Anoxybacillus gonensis TaxID=198467 RepID=UPI0002C00E14|nr:hypothetical protein [Anoxybacillus gonensis]EMI09167.1 hypothetical protein F510_2778 [Anoxybacillus gonensis]